MVIGVVGVEGLFGDGVEIESECKAPGRFVKGFKNK